jgi:hypothetical protein
MEYLYDQEPLDGIYHNVTVTGVPVSIDAVDPNGNYVHIGTVTSDAKGNFGFAWTPTIAGQYQITASFAGDDAYSSSWASSYATVSQAPQATVAPTATPNGAATVADVMTYSLLGAVAVIIVIAIVAVLLLRKRP